MESRPYYIYILASKRNGTLYIGVTNSLINRIYAHKQGLIPGFTKRYNVKNLVYYELYGDIRMAIGREKNLKAWKRKWKLELIEIVNPEWNDLYADIIKAAV